MRFRTENIYQVVEVSAAASRAYAAFTSEELHAAFTGMKAHIDNVEGGTFLSCGGQSFGRIIRLVKNKRIVLSWGHKDFPKDFYTIVDIQLEKTANGTRIHFNHIGVPDDCDGWLTDCWQNTYWRPMVAYLENEPLLV